MTTSPLNSRLPFRIRLARERERRGMSQTEVGRRTGVSGSYISQIEQGTRPMSMETAIRVANALQLEDTFTFLVAALKETRPVEARWLESRLRMLETGAPVPQHEMYCPLPHVTTEHLMKNQYPTERWEDIGKERCIALPKADSEAFTIEPPDDSFGPRKSTRLIVSPRGGDKVTDVKDDGIYVVKLHEPPRKNGQCLRVEVGHLIFLEENDHVMIVNDANRFNRTTWPESHTIVVGRVTNIITNLV